MLYLLIIIMTVIISCIIIVLQDRGGAPEELRHRALGQLDLDRAGVALRLGHHLRRVGLPWVALLVYRYLSTTASSVLCVFRRVKDHHNLLQYSPPSKKTCVRQVALDKWFPLSSRSARTRSRRAPWSSRPRPPPSWAPRPRARCRLPGRGCRSRRRRCAARARRLSCTLSRGPAGGGSLPSGRAYSI